MQELRCGVEAKVTKLADGRIHTLIVGAGPSGLATAHKLAEAGVVPLVVEKSQAAGGLMRSIERGAFTMDIGRKELYARIPEVDRLWHEILRDDYREYPHRIGSRYRGRILELSSRYRGPARGLPLSWFVVGGFDLVRCWLGSRLSKPANYEEYWHRRAGRCFARMFAQGYWEKFRGEAWADMPAPEADTDGGAAKSYSFNAIRQGLKLASQGGPSQQIRWRHPARGSGQISNRMLDRLRQEGVPIAFETEVISIRAADGHVFEVTTRSPSGLDHHHPGHLVSSMQIEDLANLLSDASRLAAKAAKPPADVEQSVVLVYLFLDEPCRFPHAWLEVNDTEMKAGRITNYAAFNGDMVPEGKACLCVEFFCVGDNPITRLSAPEVAALAIQECTDNALIDPAKLLDTYVTSMKRTNAAASWRDWQKAFKMQLLKEVSLVENLFHVNRPGMDWATFAGMVAADSILEGCRAEFDRRADPTKRYEENRRIEAANDALAAQGRGS